MHLNETVTGTLYYNEAVLWLFSEGRATVNIILDVGPYGKALIILKDPDGVDRAYVDSQSGSEERPVNFSIPTDGPTPSWYAIPKIHRWITRSSSKTRQVPHRKNPSPQ